MSPEDSFQRLLEQLRAGDEDASRQIFHQYASRLIGLAWNRLDRMDRRVLRKVDADDVVQSVFKSLFIRLQDGHFRLEDRDSLWSLLVQITCWKCGRKVREFRRTKRNVNREVEQSGEETGSGWEVLATEPTPAEALVLTETVEQALADLPERERKIVERYLQGATPAKISAEIQRSEYTVLEALRHARKRLEKLLEMSDE